MLLAKVPKGYGYSEPFVKPRQTTVALWPGLCAQNITDVLTNEVTPEATMALLSRPSLDSVLPPPVHQLFWLYTRGRWFRRLFQRLADLAPIPSLWGIFQKDSTA